MSMIEAVSSLKTAESTAQVQMALAAKLLDIANGQGQVAVQLIEAATEGMEEALQNMADGLSSQIDIYA
jgi:hypothetical protein